MKLILNLFVFTLLTFSSIYPQYTDDKIIAEIGPIKITVGEFKLRYEMTPHIGKQSKGREERLKAETLYSIIAEKLWALKADELGFDSTDIMQLTFKNVEDMTLRDALYNKEITSKIVINPQAIAEAKRRAYNYLNTRFIHSTDEQEIKNLHQKIKDGESFDSLLAQRDEYQIQKESFYQVHFGEMAETAENVLYSLKPNEVSTPIKSEEGFYIFKLYSVKDEIIKDEKTATKKEQDVRRITEARANENAYQKYYKSFFPGRKVTTNGELFWSFANKVINIVESNRETKTTKQKESVRLVSEDFAKIKKDFGKDSLALPFINFESYSIPLEKFISSFEFEGFYTNEVNPDQIRAQLNSRVRRFIELEFLAQESKREGLEELPEVKHDIQMWRDNYLATLYKKTLLDSSNVTDKEVKEYFTKINSNTKPQTLVNIITISSDNLEVVENILTDLTNENNFTDVAKKYSVKNIVPSGLVPASSQGEIGKIAKQLNIGEVYGPIKSEEHYVVFKLLDKKETAVKLPKEFEEIKHELKKEMKWKRISKKMINNTVKLANKYGVKVNEQLLFNLPVKNYNMIVYKYMGFGGRLLAVPLTPIFIEWVDKWQKSQRDLP